VRFGGSKGEGVLGGGGGGGRWRAEFVFGFLAYFWGGGSFGGRAEGRREGIARAMLESLLAANRASPSQGRRWRTDAETEQASLPIQSSDRLTHRLLGSPQGRRGAPKVEVYKVKEAASSHSGGLRRATKLEAQLVSLSTREKKLHSA